MLKLLLNDSNENETVRINALEVMVSKPWENKIFMKDMYKALKVLLGFVSWRIKYVLAKNMGYVLPPNLVSLLFVLFFSFLIV